MARGSGGGLGVLAVLGAVGAVSFVISENQRRAELERIVEEQGQRIRSLESVERQLRQTIAQKDGALGERDAELTKVRRERDELARAAGKDKA